MAIPNISDYFRSRQQFRSDLDEKARQFNEAKAQKDQQFYTNMFAAPLMNMGTKALGNLINEYMPTAKFQREEGMKKPAGIMAVLKLGKGAPDPIPTPTFPKSTTAPTAPAAPDAGPSSSGGMGLIPDEENNQFGGIRSFAREQGWS